MSASFIEALADALVVILFRWPTLVISGLLTIGLAIRLLIQLPA